MSNELEFDWDATEQKAQEAIRAENIIPVEKKRIAHGLSLAIPKGKNNWKAIDIAHATPDEFCDWVRLTYPIVDRSKLSPADFKELSPRLSMFEHIMDFHKAARLLKSETSDLVGPFKKDKDKSDKKKK